MVQSNPPLFVQDGEYPAKLDRNLIGALVQPTGYSASLVPRPGVRAHFVDGFGETSLRIEKPTAVNGPVLIRAGSAFVTGPAVDGISAIYLITNPIDTSFPMPASTPVVQSVNIGIAVTDPGDAPASGAVEGKWEFVSVVTVPPGGTVPDNFLHLATASVPANSASVATIQDQRLYTTALGGTLRVANRDTLNVSSAGAPIGTQAYSEADDLMYIRTKTGWNPYPAVAQVNAVGSSNAGITGHNGELLWNASDNILSIYENGTWIEIARQSAAVRRATATSWPTGPNESQVDAPTLKFYLPAGAWYNLSHAKVVPWDPNEKKGDPNQMVLEVQSFSPRSAVRTFVQATVQAYTKNAQGGFDVDTTNTVMLNLDAFKSVPTTVDEEGNLVFPPVDEEGRPDGYQQLYSLVDETGATWTTTAVPKNFYQLMNNLGKGVAKLQPMFKAQKAGYIEVRGLHIKVSTLASS